MEKPSKTYIIREVDPKDDVAVMQMQRLRYRVYHGEMKERFGRPWIPSNPLKLDVDGWDDYAIQHIGAYTEDNRLVGCTRLTSGLHPYMFDVFYDDVFAGLDGIHRGANACEASRLTVSSSARGKIGENLTPIVKNALWVIFMAKASQFCVENRIDWWYGVSNLPEAVYGMKNAGGSVDIISEKTLKNNDTLLLYSLDRLGLTQVAALLENDSTISQAEAESVDFQYA